MNVVKVISDKLIWFVKSRIFLWCIYIALLVLVTINVSKHGGAFPYVSFYVVLFYPIVSYAYLLYSAFAMHIYQETDKRIVDKSTPEKYHLTIENTALWPIGHITFAYDPNVTYYANDFTVDTYKLMAKEKIEIDTEMIFRYAGGYDSGITEYYVEDIFGFIRLKKKVKTPVRNHVLPAITDVANEDIERNINEKASGNTITFNRPDISLGNDTRKYAPGDALNTIHWKNYAKTGELYVRQPDNQESEMICIMTVTEVMDGSLSALKARDEFLEYLVSMVNYFGTHKKPVVICYYKLGVKTFVVDNLESFHEFYINVLKDVGTKPASGHEEDMLNKLNGVYDNIIIVRENVYKEQ